MRKRTHGLMLCLVLLFVIPIPAFAANQVNTIDIQALICGDGSMHITQVWEGDFDEGTESYIPMNAPDYLTISELTVSAKMAAMITCRIGILTGALKKRQENAVLMTLTAVMKSASVLASMERIAIPLPISWIRQ